MRKVPDRPQLGSTTDQLERNNTKDKVFNELLLELGCVTCTVSSAPANWFWGLSNLTPSRSRLFKLMGKVKV